MKLTFTPAQENEQITWEFQKVDGVFTIDDLENGSFNSLIEIRDYLILEDCTNIEIEGLY